MTKLVVGVQRYEEGNVVILLHVLEKLNKQRSVPNNLAVRINLTLTLPLTDRVIVVKVA